MPAHVREALASIVGAEIVRVHEVHGGFSPCLAGAADLADGRRVFLKAVSAAQNPESPDFVRRELDRHGSLPAEVPAPALLGRYDDGEWVAGVFEHVDGRLPHLPWRDGELELAVAAVEALGSVEAPSTLPTAADHSAHIFDGWRLLADERPMGGWWSDRLDELVELERQAFVAMRGDRLVHFDIRSDNLLLTGTGVVVVDWAHCCAGPAWVDLLAWLPSIALEGGDADHLLARLPDDDDVTAVLAALAGYFLSRGRMPDPPGLPTLRAFQAAQAEPALTWLAARLGQRM